MTGRDLISASLRLIGALAPGESLAASEATDGLASLNRMIDSWSTEGLIIHAVTAETAFALTASVATVTMGTSGNITTRPMSIESAFIRDGSTDYPLRILTHTEYAAIVDKTVQSDYPTALYDDGAFPQRTLTLYPVPSAAHSIVLFTKRALTQIATLDTAISLPPGYDEALVYNLSIRLGPEYGKPLSAEVVGIAQESKASIKRANIKPLYMKPDAIPAGGGGGSFNILSGGYE